MVCSGVALRRSSRSLAAAAAAAGLAPPLAAQTYVWRGGGPSNEWRWPQNWEPNGVPGVSPPGVGATVPEGGSTVLGWSNVVLGSLNVGGSTSLPTPRLSIGTPRFEVTVASLKDTNIDNTLFVAHGPVSFDGRCAVLGAAFEGGGETAAVGGVFTVGRTTWDGIDFRNLATVQMWLGVGIVNGATVFNNGRWEMTGSSSNGAIGSLGGGGAFSNAGQLVYNASVGPPGSGSISTLLHNSGTITAQVGTLDCNGGGNHSGGSWVVQPTGTLRLRGQAGSFLEVTGNVTASGQGLLRIGPNVSVGPGARLTSTGVCVIEGDIACEGELRNTATMTWSSGTVAAPGGIGLVNEAGATLAVAGGALGTTLTVRGTVRQTGPLTVNNFHTGDILIARGGEWLSIDRDISPSAFPPEGVVRCEGVFRKPADPAVRPSVLSVPLVLAGGRLRLEASRLTVRSGGGTELSGNAVEIAPGAEYVATGGEFRVAAGGQSAELTFSGGGSARFNAGHVLSGSGFAHVMNLLGSGGLGLLILDNCEVAVELRTQGVLDWRSATVREDLINTLTVLLSGPGTLVDGLLLNEGDVRQTGGPLALSGQARIRNVGLWEMIGPVLVSNGGQGDFSNRGRLLKSGTGSAAVTGRFDVAAADGIVEVAGGSLTLHGPVTGVTGNTLDAGIWIVHPGAALFTPGVTITAIGSEAGVVLAGTPADRWRSLENLRDNGGRFTVRGQGQVATLPGPLDNAGTLTAEGGAELRTGGTLENSVGAYADHVAGGVEGPAEGGFAGPLFINAGTMRPGGADAPGPFRVGGDLLATPTGVLEIELGGEAPYLEHDRVDVSGDAALAGTLDARLLGAYAPREGVTFRVLEAGAVRGEFDAVLAPPIGRGLTLAAVYDATGVTLRVELACYPDCDPSSGPGVLDIFDFLCFQNSFDAADPYACGCDPTGGPGVCDIFDFLCFQNAFAAGCR